MNKCVCGYTWPHGKKGPHSCEQQAQLAALRDELARVKAELVTVTKVAHKNRRDEVYCPTCKACGEDGCCPPDKCKHLACHYGAGYVKSYRELENELAAAVAELDKWEARAASLLTFVPPDVLCGDLQKAAEECAALIAASASAHGASLPKPKEPS